MQLDPARIAGEPPDVDAAEHARSTEAEFDAATEARLSGIALREVRVDVVIGVARA